MDKLDIKIIVTHPIVPAIDITSSIDLNANTQCSVNEVKILRSGKLSRCFDTTVVWYDICPEILNKSCLDDIIHEAIIFFKSKIRDQEKFNLLLQTGGEVIYEIHIDELDEIDAINDNRIFKLSPQVLSECVDFELTLCWSILMDCEMVKDITTHDEVYDFVIVSVEQTVPPFLNDKNSSNSSIQQIFYSKKHPLTEDIYVVGEVDDAITFYKTKAKDISLFRKKDVYCKITVSTESYYHYAFGLSSEVLCDLVAANMGLMVDF